MPPRIKDDFIAPSDGKFDDADMPQLDAVPLQGNTDSKIPPMKIVWKNVISMIYIHLGALYGIYLIPQANWQTLVFAYVLYFLGAFGITAGSHRLWTHRSYKAKLPFRIFLGVCTSIAAQNHIFEWSRDHRVYHKYSETNADPHNAKRGFFFSHVGWLLVRKHPDVVAKGKGIDCSDLLRDPVVVFQKKYYIPLMLLFNYILPTVLPHYFWGESLFTSYFICALFRYVFTLHNTWAVNSFAHMYGNRPYDKNINPAENVAVALGAFGEGWHNFHHTFPYDYATSELGWRINVTRNMLDLMAKLGQVYDRKQAHTDVVDRRKLRTGEHS